MTNYKAKMDFYSDWIGVLRQEIEKFGFNIPSGSRNEQIAIWHFDLKSRLITSRPRLIEKSSGFSCLAEFNAGLSFLENKILKGEDLTPHLSRKVSTDKNKNLFFHDGLLNDWGIHHLHLGTNYDNRGFIVGNNQVLFAKVTDCKIYFIDILTHSDWAKQKVIEILHSNWPELIDRYRIKGFTDLENPPTDENIESLRDAGGISLLKMSDGTLYAPPGGGIMTAKNSMKSIFNHDRHAKLFKKYEEGIKADIDKIIETVSSQITDPQFVKEKHFEFKLRFGDSSLYAFNEKYNFSVKLANYR